MKKEAIKFALLSRVACCLAVFSFALFSTAPSFAQTISVKSGEKIAFLGDSITAQGSGTPLGYVQLVINGLKANGVDAVSIPAGVSGNTSKDMLARLDRDVISKKPDWMTLSCGVNDVWHGAQGVSLEDYKTNIRQIVEKAQAANIKVVILTSTLISEDVNNPFNQTAIAYNDFLRALAKEKGCALADLNADMRAARAATGETDPKKNRLTVDGVHMNTAGNEVMAAGVLRAFGLSDAQLEKARQSWLDIPASSPIAANVAVTLRQYEQLQKIATAQKRSLNDLVNEQIKLYLNTLLTTAPPSSPAH